MLSLATVASLILPALPLALGAPATEAKLAARGVPGAVFVCTGPNWTGKCDVLQVGLNQCVTLPEPYFSSVGSAGPDPGAVCRLYDNSTPEKCGGSGLAILQNPGETDLYTSPFNSGALTQYIKCTECTACT